MITTDGFLGAGRYQCLDPRLPKIHRPLDARPTPGTHDHISLISCRVRNSGALEMKCAIVFCACGESVFEINSSLSCNGLTKHVLIV